jgi:acyl-CoA thioesterase-2
LTASSTGDGLRADACHDPCVGSVNASLVERLSLIREGHDEFVSSEPTEGPPVFGGLLVAQALRAAALTLESDQPARSLHASFLVPGAAGEPLRHVVERTRDGASFATRRVVVRQERGIVLVLTADFHREESGLAYEQPAPPGIPGPGGLPPGRYDNPYVESRDVPVPDAPRSPEHARRAWFRVVDMLPDDPALHQHALAYVSDHGPTRAVREPHARLADDARRQSVSLDHSVWFHRPVDTNGWLLSELVPVATARGRGLAIGTLRTVDGDLVATVAQEVLLRER